ncbi:MAG: fumarylacetoacetate hydrolase family protein [Candidatus Omnitrophica bacterium]|nr:fumarylacetoacetate hydrolase family protein [Candidatus Omnitrophota bacterium]
MKILRVLYQGKPEWAALSGKILKLLESDPYQNLKFAKDISLDQVKVLSPVEPGKIVLAGLNYLDHAKELNMEIPQEPVIFLKPPSSVIGDNENIVYPDSVTRLDYEAELALVIKKTCKKVPREHVFDYILGYTCLNDVTARDLQKKDIQWTRAKSFDTFSPIGPWIETELPVENLKIESFLNGKLKQSSSTANFIFSVPELIAFISKIMTLYPGDVVSTGTPPGVGSMSIGDRVEVSIEGIGILRNSVTSS